MVVPDFLFKLGCVMVMFCPLFAIAGLLLAIQSVWHLPDRREQINRILFRKRGRPDGWRPLTLGLVVFGWLGMATGGLLIFAWFWFRR